MQEYICVLMYICMYINKIIYFTFYVYIKTNNKIIIIQGWWRLNAYKNTRAHTHIYIKVYLCLYTYICTYEKETSINYGCYFCNANFYEQPAKLPTPTKPKVSRCSLITRLHPNSTHTLTYLYCIQSGLQLCQRALHMFRVGVGVVSYPFLKYLL